MKTLIVPFLFFLLFSCTAQKNIELEPNIIAYKLPFKVEQLLSEEISKNQKNEYGILIELKNNTTSFTLVDGYSYYHKNTSYRALIGEKYYPISFPQLDIKYGVVTDAEEFLQHKITKPETWDSFGKQSYPMYHGVYKIEVNSDNKIISEGSEY